MVIFSVASVHTILLFTRQLSDLEEGEEIGRRGIEGGNYLNCERSHFPGSMMEAGIGGRMRKFWDRGLYLTTGVFPVGTYPSTFILGKTSFSERIGRIQEFVL